MTSRREMEAALEAVLFVSSEPVPRERLLAIFEEDERERAEAALAAVLARYRDGAAEVSLAALPRGEDEDELGEGGGADATASDAGSEGDAGSESDDGTGAAAEAFPEGGEPDGPEDPARAVDGDPEENSRGVMIEEVAGGIRLVTRPEMNPWLRRFFEVTGSSKLSMAALETLAIVAYRQPVTGPEIQDLRSVNPSGVLKTLLEKRLVRIAGRKEVVGKPFLYTTTREFLVHFGLKSLKDLPPLEEFEESFSEEGGGLLDDDLPPDGLGEDADREESFLREVAELEEREAEEESEDGGEGEDEVPEEPSPVEPEGAAGEGEPAGDPGEDPAEDPAEDKAPHEPRAVEAGASEPEAAGEEAPEPEEVGSR